MDPMACYQRILDALADNDAEELKSACDDLNGWIRRGGFPPVVKYREIIDPSDATSRFDVLEVNGDRVKISLRCPLTFRPWKIDKTSDLIPSID